jgi:hypothetical protein
MTQRQRPGYGAVRAGVGRPAFKGEQGGGGGVSLRATAKGSQYGQDVATVRRRCQRSVGAAWPWRARRMAPGEWGREAVRRKGSTARDLAGQSRPRRAVWRGTAAGRPAVHDVARARGAGAFQC